jgi:hypothetical protein
MAKIHDWLSCSYPAKDSAQQYISLIYFINEL